MEQQLDKLHANLEVQTAQMLADLDKLQFHLDLLCGVAFAMLIVVAVLVWRLHRVDLTGTANQGTSGSIR